MKNLPLATLRTLDSSLFNLSQRIQKRIKANPTSVVLKQHEAVLTKMWLEYRAEIDARELAAASAEEVIFTTFVPEPTLSRGCVREIRRTKNFAVKGFWHSGRAPHSYTAERKPFYSDPISHFKALNKGSLLA